MQFLVTAYDGTDPEAPARRKAAQHAHRALRYDMIGGRNVLFSMMILDEAGEETIGTLQVMQFEDRKELDDWLEYEPYATQHVWKTIEVKPCRIGPAFEWMTLEAGDGGEIRMTDSGEP